MQQFLVDMVPSDMSSFLFGEYGSRASNLLDLWNCTQVRPPHSASEVEDLFFEEVVQ